MAFAHITPLPGHFHHALSCYDLARSLRRSGMSDSEAERIEPLVDAAFDTMMEEPATSPRQIIDKGNAAIEEYGDLEELPVRIIALIVADLERILQ